MASQAFESTESGPATHQARKTRREPTRSPGSVQDQATAHFQVGPLTVDELAREVAIDGRQVNLTAKEFGLLAYLCRHEGHALTREQLLRDVWGQADVGRRTVDIHVRRLRQKLGEELPLQTLRGVGYKLRARPQLEALAPAQDALAPPQAATG